MKIDNEIKQMPITERNALHRANHPKDLNLRREGKGVTWSNITSKDKALDKFYETHIYTFVDENDLSKKRWVRISGNKGEEE